VKLLYFAWVRQKVGIGEEDFSPPAGVSNVTALVEALRKRGGGYAEAFRDTSRLRCAINQEHKGFDARVGSDDEIAFFPPVTGG
jgi:molybdopterin synthase sulfur carrier subunit